MPTIIDEKQPVVTLINVFTVEPSRQAELVRLLDQATAKVMRHLRGFRSANIHRSLDGTSVTNYAQWDSKEAFEAMLADPRAQEHMRAVTALAQAAPKLYQVASVHGPLSQR